MAADEIREEVAGWLAASWDPERPLLHWRELLAESGWGCPTWPVSYYGRGLDDDAAPVVAAEFRRVAAVGPATGSSMGLAAPTILAHGSDDVKRRLLRPILTGAHPWCQLFSEPGNGSDLAGVTTRADRDGDEWVVSGQKVWTTSAHHASYGMLLARTDWDAPKHTGLTWFAFPMQQDGVEVRPLRQMNGRSSFNEVFLTDARVPHANVVGEVGGGWTVALTTLAHERGLPGGRAGTTTGGARAGRTAREAAAEAADAARVYEWYPQRAGRPDLLIAHAQRAGRSADALVRQRVAGVTSMERVARMTAERARVARTARRPPGPEGSIGKLAGSGIARAASAAHSTIAGAQAMLSGPSSPEAGLVAEILVSVPGQSIAGGTDEIQHNIIGERALGLPKEPQPDNQLPYRLVRTNETSIR